MVKLKNLSLILLVFVIFSLILSPKLAHAKFVDDFIGQVKDFINLRDDKNVNTKEIRIESDISLAPDGDMDKNGQIDEGDIIRFTYIIKNTTEQEYSFGTLDTNIDRKQLNFIHNVRGTPSLNDDQKSITIPNLHIRPFGEQTITFDARISMYDDIDRNIITQAEYLNKEKKSIVKSNLKEVVGKKAGPEKLKFLNSNTKKND